MKPKLITLKGLLAAIPEDEREFIAKGAAKLLPPPADEDEDERAFPIDETLKLST